MPKFKITWWEKNWWESIVEAENIEKAEEMYNNWDQEFADKAEESDDSFIDSGDMTIEPYTEEGEENG